MRIEFDSWVYCERAFSPIELVWCHAKKTRANAIGSIVRLHKLVPEGLDNVAVEMIYKFFRLCKDSECAYRERHWKTLLPKPAHTQTNTLPHAVLADAHMFSNGIIQSAKP